MYLGLSEEEIQILIKESEKENISNMFVIIDTKFKRLLSPEEKFTIIRFMNENNAEIKDVILAVDIATQKNIKKLNYIQGILRNFKEKQSN